MSVDFSSPYTTGLAFLPRSRCQSGVIGNLNSISKNVRQLHERIVLSKVEDLLHLVHGTPAC